MLAQQPALHSDPRNEFADHPLSFLWLEITGRCNLQCIHCYAESSPSGTHGVMSEDDWRRVIREASTLGTQTVQFIGGEPTIHPQFLELLRFAADLDLRIEVYTNLLHITSEMWDVFRTRSVSLATSFYSINSRAHDQITSRSGSQVRTLAQIQKALSLGIPIRAGIVEILPNQDVVATEQMLYALGVEKVSRDNMRGVGRGAVDSPIASPVDALCGRCAASSAAIDPEGWVYPCVFSRWLRVGNVRATSLSDIVWGERMVSTRNELTAAFNQRYSRVPCPPMTPCPPNTGMCDPRVICSPKTDGGCFPTEPCVPAIPTCSPQFPPKPPR